MSISSRNGHANGHASEGTRLLRMSAPVKPEFQFYTLRDLAQMPRPRWLIRGILVEKTCSVLSGNSGAFKSFFALHLALCIALGRDFFGREVKHGNVVYVAAEGFFTMRDRIDAWAQHHDCELPANFHILDMPVNVADAGIVERFSKAVSAFEPSFIVLDTLSQCATGLVENSNEDMARFIAGMMKLGKQVGAHILTTHHNAKATGNLRGAGAIHNNVDARIALDRPEDDETNTVFVRCEKQRGKPFEPFTLRGRELMLPDCDEYNEAITSLVFETCSDTVTPKAAKHPNAKRADTTREKLLSIFDVIAAENKDGVKKGTWVEDAFKVGIPKSTAFRHIKAMENSKIIEEYGEHQGTPLWRRKISTLTTLRTPNESSESEVSDHSHNSHTPLGVRVVRVEPESRSSENNQSPKPSKTRKSKPHSKGGSGV